QYTQQAPQNTVYAQVPKEDNTLAIISLILGIISCTIGCCLFIFGWAIAIGAIVCGIMGINKGGKGMAIAGLVLGCVGIVFQIIYMIVLLLG
ncbi:MAG: hypothetical protein ACRCTE_07090, partial [Cellulosilyticaceae bacterium]